MEKIKPPVFPSNCLLHQLLIAKFETKTELIPYGTSVMIVKGTLTQIRNELQCLIRR